MSLKGGYIDEDSCNQKSEISFRDTESYFQDKKRGRIRKLLCLLFRYSSFLYYGLRTYFENCKTIVTV